MRHYYLPLITLALAACDPSPTATPPTDNALAPVAGSPAETEEKTQTAPEQTPPLTLNAALELQDEAHQARYAFRHPEETLTFFDVQPGQTVMEFLPGGGWYSKILLPYLGEAGALIGVDYRMDMWAHFPFADDAFIAKRSTWANTWPSEVDEWSLENTAEVSAYTVATVPETLNGSVDRVLFIRALHNFHRFAQHDDYIGEALDLAHRSLTPDGLVGVVQHRAPESKTAAWADGSRGYLKQTQLIDLFKQHGFTLVNTSEVNANPLDTPGEDDIVWRLAPAYYTSKDNPALKKQYEAIGESDRMTLLFKKTKT